jgi:ATP phosphoribosyltransferase regulatory subunit
VEALAHPLPAGMRDLLPVEARRQASLARRVLESFELFGYERVAVPAFEYAEVLERGLGVLDPHEVLRFVEPETGEVVALRPDMTPQVARLLATRLASAPLPARLCYEGAVLRRRRERARRQRQIAQAGVELVGCPGAKGDLEVLRVAVAAARAAGLVEFVVDLGHARVAGALLESVEPAARARLVEALDVKDAVELERWGRASGLGPAELAALRALPDLHGAEDVFARARRALSATAALPALAELEALWRAASDDGIGSRLVIDLGEIRRFAYYTGPTFQILAEGPGRPVGAGGRYDGLFDRFGLPRPAAGFAVDLDNLDWALRVAGVDQPGRPKLLVLANGDGASLVEHLRAAGIACAPAPDTDAQGYARAWRFTHLLELSGETAALRATHGGASIELAARDTGSLVAGVASRLSVAQESA